MFKLLVIFILKTSAILLALKLKLKRKLIINLFCLTKVLIILKILASLY